MAKLEAPASYRDATHEERDAVTNGCGPEGAGAIVPNTLLGLKVTESCRIHDWEYQHGEDLQTVIDARFQRNLTATVRAAGGPLTWPRLVMAWWYHRAVSLAGGAFFNPGKRQG